MSASGIQDFPPRSLNTLRDDIDVWFEEGITSPAQILEAVVEMYQDDAAADLCGEALFAAAEREVRLAVLRQALNEVSWRGPTDCDLLDSALASLEHAGFVTADYNDCPCADFEGHCCMRSAGGVGHVHYTTASVSQSIDTGFLPMCFGGSEAITDREAGLLIVQALKSFRLAPEWDGRSTRMTVPMRWQRRILTPLAPLRANTSMRQETTR